MKVMFEGSCLEWNVEQMWEGKLIGYGRIYKILVTRWRGDENLVQGYGYRKGIKERV